MRSTRATARLAGLLYLVLGIAGYFTLMYVPGKLIVHGDPAATAANLTASPLLFRLGVVVDMVSSTLSIFLALALRRLFKDVSRF